MVIVHGAWVDGTSWREVIALLHVKGLSVIAVQNPLSALGDDVDAVSRVIKRQQVRSCSSATVMEGRSLRRPEVTRRLPRSST